MTRLYSVLALVSLCFCFSTIVMGAEDTPFDCTITATYQGQTLCFRNEKVKADFLKSDQGLTWQKGAVQGYISCGTPGDTLRKCCVFRAGCANPRDNPNAPCCIQGCNCD
jgi:hypothetical protein